MNSRYARSAGLAFFVSLSFPQVSSAADPPPPAIDTFRSTGSVKALRFEPYPAAQAYTFYSATNAGSPFTVNPNFVLSPYITGYTTITNNTTNGPSVVTVTNYAYEWRHTNATAAT